MLVARQNLIQGINQFIINSATWSKGIYVIQAIL